MNINFIKPKEINTVAKITIHKSGKMGFSRGASELLRLDVNKYAKFGFNEDKDFFISFAALIIKSILLSCL